MQKVFRNRVHKFQLDFALEHWVVVLQKAFGHLCKWVYQKKFRYVVALSKAQELEFCSTFYAMCQLDYSVVGSARYHRVKSSQDVQC